VTQAAVEIGAPKLDFEVVDVEPLAPAAAPTLSFRLRIDAGGQEIRALALNVQLRIDAARRPYDEGERERLFELFGRSDDWGRTLRSLRWTTLSTNVGPFSGSNIVELSIPCTYDFDVAASKYLHALGDEGEVPLELLFSGSVFFAGAGGALQVAHVPWDREARFSLPVRVWRQAVEQAFPGTAWVRVRRDLFDRLQAYKSNRAFLSWNAALEELLPDE
jgi:hypothetical protein